MKFAFVDNKKIEATKGAKGICHCCGSELTAKCGPVRINHWAHKKESNCDPWWENETVWHRSWKDNYPDDWQEITLPDELTGEKHIADVLTSHDLVIEFQHSHIDPKERTSREIFYKNMVWIVDGTRLKRDYPRFLKGKNHLRSTNEQGHFIVDFPEVCFPSTWLESSVPVIFDFLGIESIDDANDFLGMESLDDTNDSRNNLYCLFPKQNKREAILAIISRAAFINNTIKGEWFKEQQEPQKQSAKPLVQNKIIKRRKQATHYYDARKGRFVKKKRL